jgi:hypothetical protein
MFIPAGFLLTLDLGCCIIKNELILYEIFSIKNFLPFGERRCFVDDESEKGRSV